MKLTQKEQRKFKERLSAEGLLEAELDTSETEATKADDGKIRFDLLSPEFECEMAMGLTFGAKKYDDFNYLKGDGLELKRPYAALRRHLNALRRGEIIDRESGVHHAAAVAINAQFIYDLMTKKNKKF